MANGAENDYPYRGLMIFLGAIFLMIFICILCARQLENIFESVYFIFIYLPLGICTLLFFALAFLGKERSREKYPWICTIILVACWILSGIHFISKDSSTIGDSFGSLNALFSGMALAAVAFTILLQMKELKQNREELEGQKNELKTQNATQIQARFENSFFTLLETQRSIVKSILNINDLNAFKFLIRQYYEYKILEDTYLDPQIFKFKPDSFIMELYNVLGYRRDYLIDKFNNLKIMKNGIFDNYFRITFNILKFVDDFNFDKVAQMNINSDMSDDQPQSLEWESTKIKNGYIRILLSQISIYEQLSIFYFALNPEQEKFKLLIERYNLFNSLRLESINNSDMLLYRLSTFYPQIINNSFDIIISNEKKIYEFLFKYNFNENEFYSSERMRRILQIWINNTFISQSEYDKASLIPGLEIKIHKN